MHTEVITWLQWVRANHPDLFLRRRVLECGALDINGSPRSLFIDCDYTGLDWRPGKGVDVVSLVHDYKAEPFDVIVCCQMLEHDPYWQRSLAHMVTLLRLGGALILSSPAPGWPEHELDCSPKAGYYRNVGADEILEIVGAWFNTVKSNVGRDIFILATGRREVPCA